MMKATKLAKREQAGKTLHDETPFRIQSGG